MRTLATLAYWAGASWLAIHLIVAAAVSFELLWYVSNLRMVTVRLW